MFTRFLDPKRSVFILVMHRIALDDPAGRLGKLSGWETLALPLVAEKKERFRSRDGELLMRRDPGDFLHPGRMTPALLETLQAEIAPSAFAGQYQQRPTLTGSNLLTVSRIARYEHAESYLWTIHSWDIGVTVTGNASVCTKWGIWKHPSLGYVADLLDVIQMKLEAPDLRQAIKAADFIDQPDLIALDIRGVGKPIFQELWAEGYRHVFGGGHEGDSNEGKIQRFARATIAFYDGNARLPASAPFLDGVLQALASFPDTKELDLVDSIIQLVAHLANVVMFAGQQHRPEHLRRRRKGQKRA